MTVTAPDGQPGRDAHLWRIAGRAAHPGRRPAIALARAWRAAGFVTASVREQQSHTRNRCAGSLLLPWKTGSVASATCVAALPGGPGTGNGRGRAHVTRPEGQPGDQPRGLAQRQAKPTRRPPIRGAGRDAKRGVCLDGGLWLFRTRSSTEASADDQPSRVLPVQAEAEDGSASLARALAHAADNNALLSYSFPHTLFGLALLTSPDPPVRT